MRTRARLCLLACCCAALAACTAAAPKGPDTTVTTPAVGRPPAPQSVQAALASEAFTPYAELIPATDDGLAPGDTMAALHTACMNDAGYGQYANDSPYDVSPAPAYINVGFLEPYGSWGYIPTAEAAQDGFNVGIPNGGGGPDNPPPGLSASATAAWGKCFTILASFQNAQSATTMAGINTMSNDLASDVAKDPDVTNATKAWSACMARNGDTATAPDMLDLANGERHLLLQASPSDLDLTSAQNKTQIAEAVADADCTKATDLAGIFFAVQASYAQQLVTANQQALAAAVRQYKAGYARELTKLPALLRTTSAKPHR
jgi:hypothetical protein